MSPHAVRATLGWSCILIAKIGTLALLWAAMIGSDGVGENDAVGIATPLGTLGLGPLALSTAVALGCGLKLLSGSADR